ncbi:sugar phosphate isomerase/epimerase [Friedmanniella endophytica]|uniref:Sugar phosphate isomerase/epimerase n=1 Tax=Microlunatus kandeliicorticis TaxID=1759536 RepID=A0A7W3IVH6_9ACTN|nr:sugar phosphate isomerase/epimerase [Microlunatus kandeliicorticis]MBA8796009.1 sugar phosphate isomerase/epimerase [Microlunatus kandeliicorticis]
MPAPEISVQLYSVHEALDADLDGTLGKLADIGLTKVEAFDFVRRVPELKASFEKYGLSSPTGHAILVEDAGVETPDGLLSVPPAEETFKAAAELGVGVVIDPFVPPAKWQTREQVEATASKLNSRAKEAAEHGLKVGYHNHDHEFRSVIDGRPAYDLFVELLDPEVALEVDLYWATAGGVDPAELLGRLGDRVVAVHMKDGPMREGITAAQLPDDQCPAGQGDVPLLPAVSAGSGVEYAVIEYDHYAGDIFDGIAQSYRYLSEQL